MDAWRLRSSEEIIGNAASALFGAAVAYSCFLLLHGTFETAVGISVAAGALAFFACNRTVGGWTGAEEGFRLPPFAVAEIEPVQLDELLLTDANRLAPVRHAADLEPLILDDVLAEIAPDSRVVRLFDRKAMPTPGQLKSRIDGHLRSGREIPAVPDASQALSEALADLRRSLR